MSKTISFRPAVLRNGRRLQPRQLLHNLQSLASLHLAIRNLDKRCGYGRNSFSQPSSKQFARGVYTVYIDSNRSKTFTNCECWTIPVLKFRTLGAEAATEAIGAWRILHCRGHAVGGPGPGDMERFVEDGRETPSKVFHFMEF